MKKNLHANVYFIQVSRGTPRRRRRSTGTGLEEARKQISNCDWSVAARTIEQSDPVRRRTLGGLKVFRMKEDSSKQTATQSQTSSVIGSVNVSSSQAVALDANMTQTLEERVITSTWLDNNTEYIVNNQRDKFKRSLMNNKRLCSH